MDDFFITPSERADFVELSRTPTGTKLFKKHILSTGTLNYNGKKIPITESTLDSLKKNFDAKVCDIVQVPVADKDNNHTEDPLRNAGEVIDLERDGNKLYAIIDARKYADDFGKTLIGASAFFSMDYKDTRTDEKVGPTLLHVAVTNRPHEVELEDYQELIAASADGNSEAVHLTALTEKESDMTKDELISALKIEHGIDVADLQGRVAAGDKALALSNSLTQALSGLKDQGVIALSNTDELTGDDVVGAFAQLAEKNVALSNRIDTIEADGKQKAAEVAVDKAIADGFIFPAKRDANIALYLSNKEQFEALLPEKPLVALSAEALKGDEDSEALSQVDAEIVRLSQTDAAKQYIGA
jgi:hypothetical protein